MDIQAEKLELIEWLTRLNDINIIKEIKALRKETEHDLFKRYNDHDLIQRSESSIEDIATGRTTKLSDFKTEIKTWESSKNTQ